MSLPTDYAAGVTTWPIQFVPPHKPAIPTTNGTRLVAVPALLMRDTFTNASTIDTDGIGASQAGPAVTGSLTIDGALATAGVATLTPARNWVINVTHGSSIVACNGVVTGKDMYGAAITETWAITATGTDKTATGNKAFKTISSITIVMAGSCAANTYLIGDGKKLGLSYKTVSIVPIDELEGATTPTAGVIVAGVAASATADARGTYAPNSTLDGAKDFSFCYVVVDPTVIT